MGNLQSNPSSSTQTSDKRFEVFLNFRGIDTRYGFTNTLYEALRAKSIETFMDESGLEKGDEIGPNLLKTIRDSKISVVVFSKNYASSKWCLRELVEIMKCQENHGQTVIPVFYDVAVEDVKKLEESFKDGFDQLKEKFYEKLAKDKAASIDPTDSGSCMASFDESEKEFLQEMQNWREALIKATRVKGWNSSETRSETKLVDEIVKDISKKLMSAYIRSPCDFRGLYGFEERFEKVMSLLCLHNTDIRIIGIWGMGGIGKTTIADAIFHQISDDEYGKCFIQNVRQRLEQCGGLVSVLQEEILSQVLNDQDIKLHSLTLPQHIKERLCRKRIFIVLDDVDDFLKLQNLAGGLDRLRPGSRIVLTSRNRDILNRCGVNDCYIYNVQKLSDQEGLRLFHDYAFKQQIEPKDLMALSHELLSAIDGNPLGLKVVGSTLSTLNKDQWVSALSRLKKSPEILGVLQISYDGLEDEDKHTFLDIACFYVGKPQDYVAEILGNYSYSLEVLSNRSLITISSSKIIQMHDLLQEMGRKIVYQESPDNPGNRSRLWIQEEVLDTLENGDGTNAIRGIFWDMSKMNEKHLSSQAFEKMKNLRFLKFYDSTFYGIWDDPTFLKYKDDPALSKLWDDRFFNRVQVYSSNVCFRRGLGYLSNKMRSIDWLGYPLKALPSNFVPEHLVELTLRHSNIEELWEKNMHAPNLKWIILETCPNLFKFSGLSAPLLEKIYIQNCERLRAVVPYDCKNLRELSLRNCKNLWLRLDLNDFPSLVYLDLYGCINFCKISTIEGAPRLEKINLENCRRLHCFPSPSIPLNNLCNLNLRDCKWLQSFPTTGGNMHFSSPTNLKLSGIGLAGFPCISGNIKWLSMRETGIEKVPSSIENLTELVELDLAGCKWLKSISDSICKLKALRELNLSNCSALVCFPKILETMESLKILDLSGTAIKKLHQSIENLIVLSELHLWECKDLEMLPISTYNLTSLKSLNLFNCEKLKHLPPNSVTVSNYGGSGVTQYPFCRLNDCDLRFTNCLNLNTTAVSDILKLLINQHRDMKVKGCGSRAINLRFLYPGSEVPGWFSYRTEGSSTNVQMPGHDLVNGQLIGLAESAVIEVKGHSGEPLRVGYYYNSSSENHGTDCEDTDFKDIDCESSIIVAKEEIISSDHVALWYSDVPIPKLRESECTNYLFKFFLDEESPNCRVRCCGVHPIYENFGATDQDLRETSVKEHGKIRIFSDEAETSGKSDEDVMEPQSKRTCT